MQRSDYRSTVNFGARLFLGLLLIVAAALKLSDLSEFAERIGDFGIVFDALVKPTAWAVVSAECLIGVALITRRRGGLAGAGVLLLMFTGVLMYGIALGLDIDCGCFGPAIHISLWTQLLMDCGLLLICAIIYGTEQRRKRIEFDAGVSPLSTPNESP